MKVRKKIIFLISVQLVRVTCLFRGKANTIPAQPKKIAIVQLSKLGDMVCATPMFRAIKEKYPAALVFVIGNKVNASLLKDHPHVDQYIVSHKNFLSLLRRLRKENIDFACTCAPNIVALLLLLLAGIRCIAAPKVRNGQSPYENTYYLSLLPYVIQKPHTMGQYVPREYLRLLEPIGIVTDDTSKRLAFSVPAKQRIDQFFVEHHINPAVDRVVGISPSAGNKIKCWDPQRFAEVAQYITSNYTAYVIVIGTRSDQHVIDEMMSSLSLSERIFNTCDMFTLDELKALVAASHLFISVDSGPIYIAEAFGVATIDIVGPVDEQEQPPQGEKHRLVIAPREKSQLHVMNARQYDAVEAKRQVEDITVSMVTKEVDLLLQ